MNVVLSGIYYPMAILRYFEAALRRRESQQKDINLFTIGPYTETFIPWNGGMDLPVKYAKPPDFCLPKNGMSTGGLPYSYLETHVPFKPDLWIHVDAGLKFGGRPENGTFVVIGTDPHVLDYDIDRKAADVFFCMQTPYMKAGDEYLPYGYDPVWHAPPEKDLTVDFDVALLGLHYQERNSLMFALQQKGVRIKYELGPVFDEARDIYNRSFMVVNWSSKLDLTARVFEGAALGNLVVCNDVPDLKKFFESGKEVVTFTDMNEALEKIQYYLKNPLEGEEIARAGRAKCLAHGYSWDERIDQVLATVKTL
jgi:glycosyltransferase involved in cell wall biosynthesis